MKKLSHLILSATMFAAFSLPVMADEDSGITVTQIAPATSAGGTIAPSGLTGLGGLTSTQLGIAALVLIGGVALSGGSGGGSNSVSTTGTTP